MRWPTAKTCVIGGIMEHIEEAGVHSGDSSCVLPAVTPDAFGAGAHPRLHEAAWRKRCTSLA